ncbi:RcpC/CpaB family pilus assembly protein [Sinomonas sp. JGH33]|uniref:RcpC/CpaB family pilus assembly protein n=1 Tax=Sinomonas terricola TaxID=3110330 RepID=A0ABU5T1A3_9MICC|nr:RcpC/CpaB family pilus assembly protein [Sinomonas sp. JGH33]MEA5453436.1 RcpC/CpaB family pilus assembly protein [Sinomonas sp. JGH33]
MKSRLVAGAAALVAAIIGVVLVISYANGADARAQAGMQPTDVLVVVKAVPQGTPSEQLGDSVKLKTLPADAIAPTALHSLDGMSGKVVSTALQPGEQLLSERLVAPNSLAQPGTVPVPAGLQEVSFQLSPDRAVGGKLQAGDTVGIFLSFDHGAVPTGGPESTELAFHTVLLTSVQGGQATTDSSSSTTNAKPATVPLMITVAVTDVQAAKIVFAAQFGTIWLSKEPANAAHSNTGPIERGKVYQ